MQRDLDAILNPDTADINLIDPTKSLNEQTQLLPFNKQWEIPRRNVTLRMFKCLTLFMNILQMYHSYRNLIFR